MNIQLIIDKIDFQKKIQLTPEELNKEGLASNEYYFLVNEFLPELRADLIQLQKDTLSILDQIEAVAKFGISV